MIGTGERGLEVGRELDRIVFFSDAVFAIVITLLVLDIRVPDIPPDLVSRELPDKILALGPKLLSYVHQLPGDLHLLAGTPPGLQAHKGV